MGSLFKIIITLCGCFIFSFSKAQTFNGTGGAIPDNNTLTCYPLTVSGVGVINTTTNGLASVTINITHFYDADLDIYLKAPDGTMLELSTDNGGSGQNYQNTTFNETATVNITQGASPFAGSYTPEGTMGTINNGQNANGVWSLCIRDDSPTNAGVLNGFSITFSTTPASSVLPACAGNLAAGNTCAEATPICNFNGYCGNTSASYTIDTWPELTNAFDINCYSGIIDNNSFVKFVAGATSVSMNVWVYNSTQGFGIQMMIYGGGCGSGAVTTYGCINPMEPSSNAQTITASGLTVGNTYYLMIDGYAGDVCDYTIKAISGINVLSVNPAAPVICSGGAGTALTASGGGVPYTWSPATGLSATTGATVIANPAGTTTYTVTSVPVGSCPATKTVTVTVVAPPAAPTVTSPVNYCQNATATPLAATGTNLLFYNVASGGTGVSSLTPSTITPGTYTFYATQNPAGCESVRTPITVNITASTSITLSSAAGTNVQTVCTGTPITNITYSTASGVTGVTFAGLPPGVTGTYSGGVNGTVTLSGSPSTTTGSPFNYTITAFGSCGFPTATGKITVGTAPVITRIGAATRTICINTPLAGIAFTITGAATGATATGMPAGVTGTYTAGNFNVSGTPTVSGSFLVTVTTTGGCGPVSATVTINVTAASTLTLTSAAGTNAQTSCISTAITPITYSTVNGVTGATVTGLPAGFTGTYSGGTNGTVTISGTPTTTTGSPFNYTVTTTGGCGTATASGTIIVRPLATLVRTSTVATTAQTVCTNATISNITYTAGGSATGVTFTGLPAGVTGSYSAGSITISGAPTTNVGSPFNYTVSTTGGCTNLSLSGTITVNPDVTLTLTSGSNTQTVCANAPISNINYLTANGVTGATITGLPAGVTGTYSGGTNGTILISGAPTTTVGSPFTYSITTTGGCSTATLGGTITVNPVATIALTTGSNTQTLCVNTAITTTTYNIAGSATGATVSGLPTGVTGSYSGGVVTISGTPTTSVGSPFNYSVTTTGGSCGTPSLSGTITVNPTVTLTLTSGSNTQTVCANAAISNINYSTANGVTGATITGLPAGVTGAYSGGTNGTILISGAPTTTVGSPFNYNIITTGGCSIATLVGTITVDPLATISLASGSNTQTVCASAAISTITYNVGGSATGATVSGLPAGVTGTYSAGVVTISGIPTTSVGSPFNYTVSTTGGSCGTPSLTGTITVNPAVTLTLVSGSNTQTICANASIANINYSTANGVTGVTITGLPAGVTGIYSGGTNGTILISGSPTTSVGSPFTYSITTTGGCSTATLGGTIAVNPVATIALASGSNTQTVCANTAIATITYNIGGSATGATVSGLPPGVTGTYSAGDVTISGTPTTNVGSPFNYTVTTTGGTCGTPSLSGTITVNPDVTLTLTSGSNTQTVCANAPISNINYLTANGVTGATITGLPAGVTGTYSGGTNGTILISGAPTTTFGSPFTYSITTTGGCSTATLGGTITVNAVSTISLASGSNTQTICINTAITNITYNIGGSATGATVSGLPTGVTGAYSGGVVTISGTPTSSISSPFNYTVTTTGGTCGAPSLSGTITVNPAVTLTLTSGSGTQTVCANTAISNINYSTANGITGATITGLPAGVTGTYSGGTNGTILISGAPTTNIGSPFSYNITTTGGCGTATLGGTITVNPVATISLASGSNTQSVCANTAISTITYNVGGSATGATVSGLPPGVTGSFSGGVVTISGTPTISVGSPFNYIVTTTGGICGTPALSGTITVDPAVTLTLVSGSNTQTVCANAAISNINYSTANGVTGATITGLPAGVTGAYSGGTNGTILISGAPTTNIGSPFSYNITTTGGCGTATLGGTITVNPVATISLASGSNTQSVCANTAISTITYNVGGSATGATVSGLPPGVTESFSGGVVTISGTPTTSVGSPFNYIVTTTGGTCGTPSLSGSITVNPAVTLTLTSGSNTQTVCANAAISNINYSTANGVTGVTITGLPAGVTGIYSGGTNGTILISGTPTTTIGSPSNYNITTTGGCSTATLVGTITVNPVATIALASGSNTQTVCANTAISTITYNIGGSATGATVSGLPAGVTGSYSGGVVTISGTPTTNIGSPFNYTVSTTGGTCGTPALSGTITVNPNATITLASGSNTQTVCINSVISTITYYIGGSATGATVSGLPAGVTGTYSGGVVTISGTATTSVGSPFNYIVTTTGGTCGTPSLSGTITVNPDVTLLLTSGSNIQTACSNSAISNINYSTVNGVTGVVITGLPAGVTGVYSGGTNGTILISGAPTTTIGSPFNYNITTTGGCGTATLGGTITVSTAATIALTSGSNTQAVCINTAISTITYNIGGSATGATVTGLPAGISGTYAAGIVTINGTATTITGSPYGYVVTTTGGCGTATLGGTITVDPLATISLASGANTQTVCANTAIGTITYNVGGSATGGTVSGLPPGVIGSFSGGVVTISGTPTISVGSPFNYIVTTTGGSCGTPTLSGTITVNPAVTLTLTSGSNTQTICANASIANINYSTSNGVTSVTITGLPAGVTGTYSGGTNGTILFSGAPTTTVGSPFNYNITTTGGCSTATLGGTIAVNPLATISLASGANTQTVCANTAIGTITYNVGGSATGATVSGLPTGVTGAYSGGVVTISGTPTSSIGSPFNYTVTTTGGTCGAPSLSGTITVNPAVTLTLVSGSNTQSVCANAAIGNINYSTANGVTGATITGLPAGVTGTYSGGTNGTILISGSPTTSVGSPFTYSITTTGGCSTATLGGTITVNPVVTITLASGSNTQTVCANTAIATITYNIGGIATGATVSGLPAGVTGTYSAGVVTINGIPTTSVGSPFNYSVTTTGGSCGTPSLTGSITVNPAVTLTLTSGSNTQTVCANAAISNINYSTANGVTGVTITGLPAGVTGIYSGGTNGTILISGTPTTTIGSPSNYNITTTGGCSTATLVGTITVNPVATIALASGSNTQTVCANTAISTITYNIGGSATGATVTGLPTGVTGTYSGGVVTISGTPTTSTGSPFNYSVTTTGGSCGTPSLSGSITVNPEVILTLTSGSNTQTVCANAAISNINYSTANGVTGATITGLPAGVTGVYSGGTDGTIVISGAPTTTVGSPFNYNIITTGGCGTVTLSGMITVNPVATITLNSPSGSDVQNVCVNNPINSISYLTANGVTGAAFSGLPAGISGTYSGGTNGTITISGAPANTTGSPFSYNITTTGGCGTATATGSITVNPNATITLNTAGTNTQTVCSNAAINNIVYQTANGVTNVSVAGLPAGVSGVYSGGINGTFTISGQPNISTGSPFTFTVTATGGCDAPTLNGTITVTPLVTLTLNTAGTDAQNICINNAINNIVYQTANGVTGVSASGLPAGVSGAYSGGINGTFTISGSPNTIIGSPFIYAITTTGACGTATANGSITVDPAATITLNTAGTNTQSICVNTSINNIVYQTANGVTNVSVAGLPAGVSGVYSGGTNGTFTISGMPNVSTGSPFNFSITTTGGCGTATAAGIITVNPDATMTLTSAAGTNAQSVCLNAPITNIAYTTANGVTAVSVSGLPSGMSGTFSGNIFTISGTPTTATGSPFAYTVTTTGGCGSVTLAGTITVNATSGLSLTSASANETVCINTAMTDIAYATIDGATGATVTGLPAGVSGTYSAGVLTIGGTPTVTGTFNYTVSTTGGCNVASLTGTITVNPDVTISLTSAAATTNQSICANGGLVNITYSTANGVTGITSTGLPSGVNATYSGGANGTVTISGSTPTSGMHNYTIATTGGCSAATLAGTITVNPITTLVLVSGGPQTSCVNIAITPVVYNVSGSATGATVTGLPAGVAGVYSNGTFTISGAPTASSNTPFNFTVTTTGGNCGTASLFGTIIVRPLVTLSLTSGLNTQTVCAGAAISNINYSTANGVTNAIVTGLPAGVTAVYSGGLNGMVLISGAPTTTTGSPFNYTITTIGDCGIATLSGAITVNALSPAPVVISPVVYCPGATAHALSQDVTTGTNLLYYTTQFGGTGSSTAPVPSTAVAGSSVTYWVSQHISSTSCESVRVPIIVNVSNPLTINIGPDANICEGDTARFTPTVTPAANSYQWTAVGGNNSTITNPTSLNTGMYPAVTTQYTLSATLAGCTIQQSVTVNVKGKPVVDAGTNVVVCFGDSALLVATVTNVTGNNITYSWTPAGSLTTPNAVQTWAHPAGSTWYRFTATTTVADYGCAFRAYDSVKLIMQPKVNAFAGNDTIASKDLPHQLHGSGGINYLWSSPTATFNNPLSQNPTTVLNNDANIFLQVKDAAGCIGYDSVFIKVYEGPKYYVPTAFSPNGDGLNDVFRVIPSGIATTVYFRVFNRYGQLVFETNQFLKGWDGTFNGAASPQGTYVWILKGVDRNNKPVEMKGSVILVR